jgi:hypothetical protein
LTRVWVDQPFLRLVLCLLKEVSAATDYPNSYKKVKQLVWRDIITNLEDKVEHIFTNFWRP